MSPMHLVQLHAEGWKFKEKCNFLRKSELFGEKVTFLGIKFLFQGKKLMDRNVLDN